MTTGSPAALAPEPRRPSPVTASRVAAGVQACLAGDDTPARDLERTLARQAHDSLSAFVQQCFHILDPATELEWTWHLDLICRELEAVTAGVTRDLLICVPPGTGKSLLVSVLWPAWWWLREPAKRFVALSGGDDLALRDNRRMREVVESEWYQRLVGWQEGRGVPRWGFAGDQNAKRYFENSARGHRQCFSIGGSVTGQRGDGLIVDDPHQVRDVLGDAESVRATLDKAWNRVSVILASRVYDRRVSWRVTILQRVHLDDVGGRILRQGTCKAVILPMRFDPESENRHQDDPRTEPGELLDPVRMPEHEVASLAAALDEVPGQSSAQLDQRPVPATGGLIKTEWTANRYDFDPQRPEVRFPLVVVSVDATFKKTEKGSYVSITAWGIRGPARYLLGEVHARMDYVETREALRDFCACWLPGVVLVEEKANGAALVRDLRDQVPGVIAVTMDKYGDKMARAQLAAPAWAAGNVWLPDSRWMPTVGEFIGEIRAFPFGADDRMDGWSQLQLWLADNEAMWNSGKAVARGISGVLKRLGR